MFAVGVLTGTRPGEVIGLEWGDADLEARRILVQRQVRHGKVGPTKSNKPRLVPLIEPLAKILAEWRLATGGAGLVVTERYAHLRSDLFRPEDLLELSVSMSRQRGAVVELAAHRNNPGPGGARWGRAS